MFGYELKVNVSLANTRKKLYCIRADWSDGDVGYYRIGENCKGDLWYPPSQKCYAVRYYRREAKRQMKMLCYLFRRHKNMQLSLEEA